MLSITIFLSSLVPLTLACGAHDPHFDVEAITSSNLRARAKRLASAPLPQKIAITNVSVFDGWSLLPPQTIVIGTDGLISPSNDLTDATLISGTGQFLLPGLIDSHSHPQNSTHLQSLTSAGVTTTLLMACPAPQFCASLNSHPGLVSVISGSLPAAAINSTHGRMLSLNSSNAMTSPSQAPSWVGEQISSGATFIKLVTESPGLPQSILNATVAASHAENRSVICHSADFGSVQQALLADVDQIHHSPNDREIDSEMVQGYLRTEGPKAGLHRISVPTLVMMKATAENKQGQNFSAAVASAKKLFDAAVPMLVGTDSNGGSGAKGSIGAPPFGKAMWDELELMVNGVGMEPVEALRAATAWPAIAWGLGDRGMIEVGKRADLVLVGGDPTRDVGVLRGEKRVWVGGVEYLE